MSLFVLIPGFGAPHDNMKLQILQHNIKIITQTYPTAPVDFHICVYDDTTIPPNFHQNINITIHREPGLPGDFIKKFATPDIVRDYQYILILFDDILLLPGVDMAKIIKTKEYFALDIISPTLSLDSKYIYKYMLTNPEAPFFLRIVPCCELFCCLYDNASYTKYYEHVDPAINPWLWGLDLILHYKLNMRVGLLNKMSMKHFFQSTCYDQHPTRSAFDGYAATMKKYDIDDDKVLIQQPESFYWIMESSRT